LLALPLFLLAATQAAGYRVESSWLAALSARAWPALLLCALGAIVAVALLTWPAWRLQQTGSLGAVLLAEHRSGRALAGVVVDLARSRAGLALGRGNHAWPHRRCGS
jgi:hypothetical protein